MNKKFFIPIFVFILMAALLFFGLGNNSKNIPSPLVAKLAPRFVLPRLYESEITISSDEMLGKVWMFNLWASWCHSCRAEHKVLSRFIKKTKVATIGLNYKDYGKKDFGDDAKQWLNILGNPYYAVAVDTNGDVGFDWGVVGVPETFVIDKKGIIRYKFTGPVYEEAVEKILIPLIDKLRKEES